jgi:putative ABC transport system permease protein
MLLVSKDFIILVLIGAVIACPVAYYFMNKWLSGFDYQISMKWYVFAFAFIAAIIIALISVGWQAWRAAKANPVEALKYE